MRQDSLFPAGRHMDTPRFTTSALTLRSEETALRVRLRRLPRCCGQGGTAGRGAALHEVEFPIKRNPGQTCAPPRRLGQVGFLTTTTPARLHVFPWLPAAARFPRVGRLTGIALVTAWP